MSGIEVSEMVWLRMLCGPTNEPVIVCTYRGNSLYGTVETSGRVTSGPGVRNVAKMVGFVQGPVSDVCVVNARSLITVRMLDDRRILPVFCVGRVRSSTQ
jgi:hypothetical protein